MWGTYTDRVDRVKASLRIAELTSKERNYVYGWAEGFADIFYIDGERLTITNGGSIDTLMKPPTKWRIKYRNNIKAVWKQTPNPLITPPLWIVPKKLDGSGERKWRVVIDFRVMNEKVIGDGYLFPNITVIPDHLGKPQDFPVLGLASRFLQVETHPDDRIKIALSTPPGHFEYLRVSSYKKEAAQLGHIIGYERLKPNPAKIEAIKNFTTQNRCVISVNSLDYRVTIDGSLRSTPRSQNP